MGNNIPILKYRILHIFQYLQIFIHFLFQLYLHMVNHSVRLLLFRDALLQNTSNL